MTPPANPSTMLVGALIAGIHALAAAVVFLFFWFRSSYKRIEEKLDERDKERDKLWHQVSRLKKFAGLLASCPNSHCPFREAHLDDDDDCEACDPRKEKCLR